MTQTALVYGQSLYSLAKEEQLDRPLLEQLEALCALWAENPAYVRLLALPAVPKDERCALLDEGFRGQVHPYLLNFLKILTRRGSASELPACTEAFRGCYYADHGIQPVTAVTAVPLSPERLEQLRAKLSASTGKTILLKNRVDPAVLGGVKLELDGKQLDDTLHSRLEGIRSALSGMVL